MRCLIDGFTTYQHNHYFDDHLLAHAMWRCLIATHPGWSRFQLIRLVWRMLREDDTRLRFYATFRLHASEYYW